jgi:hypothetical protein
LALDQGRPRVGPSMTQNSGPTGSSARAFGVYAQCMKRSQIDEAVVWQLMHFPDEAENRGHERTFGPTNRPTRTSRPPRRA